VLNRTTGGTVRYDATYSYNDGTLWETRDSHLFFSSDNGGRLTQINRPGSYIHYDYNARNWLTAVLNRTTGGAVRYDASYYYNDGALWDNTGNPLKRVENFGGSDFTTTLRYDGVYRQTEETKRNSGGVVQYSLLYGYDEVGSRTTRTLGGVTTTYTYDDNDKLTRAQRGAQPSNFGYDANGNITSITGPLYGTKTMVYNDENRLTSVTYSGMTDTYEYNWQGLRTSASLGGSSKLYLYDGQRVYQERLGPNVTATYMTEDASYFGSLLHLQRATGESRFPMYDMIGSARGLVDANGAVTDTYEMDAFGKPVSTTGSTPNPYRFGAAWGYITDPSGFLQLGARFYWPELGRFVQQDPIGDGVNWYAYAGNSPVVYADPEGHLAIGAVIGGAYGVFGGVAGTLAQGGGWGDAAIAGVVGGAFGAGLGLLDFTEGIASIGVQVAAGAAIGAGSGAAGDIGGQAISHALERGIGDIGNLDLDWSSVAGSALIGGIGGTAGGLLGGAAASVGTGPAETAYVVGLVETVIGFLGGLARHYGSGPCP
jgi:RHS repeat-associated protein